MNARTKPTLRGERVTLRPIAPADAEAMLAATREPVSTRLTGTHRTFELDEIRAWCERVATAEDRLDLAITATVGGTYLGEVVLNELDETNRNANFRIGLAAPRHFGRGYGREASRLMLDYGFRTLGLHRVSLEVFVFNERATRLYESLGFRHEGRLREVLLWDGAYHDALVMGLLRDEWERASERVG